MMPVQRGQNNRINDDEPEEIRLVSKKALLERLKEEYYLPNDMSRLLRRYLVGVYTGEYFRVRLVEIKHFQAELTPRQLKKAPILNNADAYAKLNAILREQGRPPLGYAAGTMPEESWFINVARFIDKQNVTGIFLVELPGAPQINSESQRMLDAKKAAEDYLLNDNHLLGNQIIYTQVREVWESQKRLTSKLRDVESALEALDAARARVTDEETKLQSKLMGAALTIFTVGNGRNADRIFLPEEDGPRFRLQIQEITTL